MRSDSRGVTQKSVSCESSYAYINILLAAGERAGIERESNTIFLSTFSLYRHQTMNCGKFLAFSGLRNVFASQRRTG